MFLLLPSPSFFSCCLYLFYTYLFPLHSTPLPCFASISSLFRERMKLPFMTDQCEQMLKICNEFVRLQVSYDEYLCMKVLLLLSTGNETHFYFTFKFQ